MPWRRTSSSKPNGAWLSSHCCIEDIPLIQSSIAITIAKAVTIFTQQDPSLDSPVTAASAPAVGANGVQPAVAVVADDSGEVFVHHRRPPPRGTFVKCPRGGHRHLTAACRGKPCAAVSDMDTPLFLLLAINTITKAAKERLEAGGLSGGSLKSEMTCSSPVCHSPNEMGGRRICIDVRIPCTNIRGFGGMTTELGEDW